MKEFHKDTREMVHYVNQLVKLSEIVSLHACSYKTILQESHLLLVQHYDK